MDGGWGDVVKDSTEDRGEEEEKEETLGGFEEEQGNPLWESPLLGKWDRQP